MRSLSAVVIVAVGAPLVLGAAAAHADPSGNGLRVIPQIAPGRLVAVPNARQIVPLVGPASRTVSVSSKAQRAIAHAGGYLSGIAAAVKQAVVQQSHQPMATAQPAPVQPTQTAAAPALPSTIAAPAAPVAPQLVAGPQEVTRTAAAPSAPSAPVLVAAPRQVTRVAQKAAPTKIAVYTCHLGEDYSLKLKKCVPEARPSGAATAVAAAKPAPASGSGVTATRTVARVSKPGAVSGSVLAGRIDSSAGRMALGVKAQRK